MGKLAYLFPAFPVFHQTFVLWEVLGVQRNGVHPRVYALRRPAGPQQPDAQRLSEPVTYLPSPWSLDVWRANWRLFGRNPGRYLRLFVGVFRAWQTGAVRAAREAQGQRRPLSPYDRLRGWFNGDPLLYLLKSWFLVPISVYLAERLQTDGITHLHVHWASYPATVALIVHLVSELPFSISAHAYDIYMVPRMLPAKVHAARFVVTCAKTNAAFLKSLSGNGFGDKILVSYHGVDVERFAPLEGRAAGTCRFTLVSCGQLEPYKGMHVLVDACARLRHGGLDLECWIIGEGPQRTVLREQIERLGLGECVRLTGALPQAEVAERLRNADVFALASQLGGRRRDVIANVIVEAMAAGLPVVASRIPGIEELIDDGTTGYLVAPNQPQELAAAIQRLADQPSDRQRLGQAARQRILQDFDSSKNVRRLAGLLAALLEEPAPITNAVSGN